LEAHPQVERVSYPGLKSSPSFALAQKYLKKLSNYGASSKNKMNEIIN